jgi:hypothetical protein
VLLNCWKTVELAPHVRLKKSVKETSVLFYLPISLLEISDTLTDSFHIASSLFIHDYRVRLDENESVFLDFPIQRAQTALTGSSRGLGA